MCHDEHIDSGTTGAGVLIDRCGSANLCRWHDGKGERGAVILRVNCKLSNGVELRNGVPREIHYNEAQAVAWKA